MAESVKLQGDNRS